MGDLNPHAQCLKLSNGGKKRGQDKTLVVSLFYRMDCSFPAGDFMMQLLVRQGDPNNCSSAKLGSWVLGSVDLHSGAWGVYKLNKKYYQDKHTVRW